MLVGAVIRTEPCAEDVVRRRLQQIEGVEVLPAARDGKVGIVIEAPDADVAHGMLTERVGGVPGVLAAWPVSAWYDDPEPGVETTPAPFQGERHVRFTA